jgi:hypothetical protein
MSQLLKALQLRERETEAERLGREASMEERERKTRRQRDTIIYFNPIKQII